MFEPLLYQRACLARPVTTVTPSSQPGVTDDYVPLPATWIAPSSTVRAERDEASQMSTSFISSCLVTQACGVYSNRNAPLNSGG